VNEADEGRNLQVGAILTRLCQGHTDKAIAQALGLEVTEVKAQIALLLSAVQRF